MQAFAGWMPFLLASHLYGYVGRGKSPFGLNSYFVLQLTPKGRCVMLPPSQPSCIACTQLVCTFKTIGYLPWICICN